MKRKAEITFEVEETIIVRQRAKLVTAFCPQCASHVEMAAPQTIAAWSELTEREIFRLVEAGEVHFVEVERILICLKSLTG
jgi:hypothetical protein